jgi:lysophospholipid acyltransferase (LPLAT)-like uncharacterized protein
VKLRSPLLIRILAWLLGAFVWSWVKTIHVRYWAADGRQHPVDASSERFIYAFWHDSMLAPMTTRTKIEMLVSQHADGELVAGVCQWVGFGLIRGSSTRGGFEALVNMINRSDSQAHLGFTPDGPKGPRHRVQVGMIYVASRTGVPIVPCGYGFTHARRLRSWDRFAVPRPFSRIVGVVCEPIHVPPNLDRAGLESWRIRVEEAFLEATAQAEDWAERIRRDGPSAPPPQVASAAPLRAAA